MGFELFFKLGDDYNKSLIRIFNGWALAFTIFVLILLSPLILFIGIFFPLLYTNLLLLIYTVFLKTNSRKSFLIALVPSFICNVVFILSIPTNLLLLLSLLIFISSTAIFIRFFVRNINQVLQSVEQNSSLKMPHVSIVEKEVFLNSATIHPPERVIVLPMLKTGDKTFNSQVSANFSYQNQDLELSGKTSTKTFNSSKDFILEPDSNQDSLEFHFKPKNNFDGIIDIKDIQTSIIPKQQPDKTDLSLTIEYIPDTDDQRPLDDSDIFSEKNFHESRLNLNNKFKDVEKKLGHLTDEQIFYINILEIPYSREILSIEFFKIEILKLYLDLCQQADVYLKKQNSSLKKRSRQNHFEYYSHYNTFYTLFCISEFTIEEFYYGRANQNVDYSFNLIEQQLGLGIDEYIKQFINLKLKLLPTISEELKDKIFYNLSSWQMVGLMYKRLELSDQQKKYFEIMFLNKNSFLEIEECFDETAKLFLRIIYFLKEIPDVKDNAFLKSIILEDWKKITGYGANYSFKNHDKTLRFLNAIFKICENRIRYDYNFGRQIDVSDEKGYVRLKCGKIINLSLQEFLSNYTPEKPNIKTLIEINARNKTRWKGELQNIFENEKSPSMLVQKAEELSLLNSKNSSRYLLYFELSKKLASFDKSESCWYYYQYCKTLFPEKPNELPSNYIKMIFNGGLEKLNKFKFIIQTIDPRRFPQENKKQEINELFEIKRKEIKLDFDQVKQADQTHQEMTQTLNEVLQEEQTSGSQILLKQTVKKEQRANSIEDFFNDDE